MPNIREIIKKQKAFYKSVVSVFCPLLNDTIYFTGEGFNHLLGDNPRKRRDINEQYLKLMCLSHAPTIAKNSVRIVEVRKGERFVKHKKKSTVTYELVDGKKRRDNIAVVVERIGTGKLKFRSVKKIRDNRYNNKKAPFGA